MLKRCYDSKCSAYRLYGAKGIIVCKRWLGKNGFKNFYKDLDKRPDGLTLKGKVANYTLERKDSTKNYCPSNCKWATRLEQNRNTNRVKCTMEIADSIRSFNKLNQNYRANAVFHRIKFKKEITKDVVRGIIEQGNWQQIN